MVFNAMLFVSMQWGGWSDGARAVTTLPALNAEKIQVVGSARNTMEVSLPSDGKSVCMEWGDFFGDKLQVVSAAVMALNLGGKVSRRETERSIGYWVYMSPLKDKAAVNDKIRQLKDRGITEYFVEKEAGPWQNAISLGLFKTEASAKKFLGELRAKDVNTAKVGERISKFKAVTLLFAGIKPEKVSDLTRLQQGYPKSELKNVPCALTR